MYKHSKHLNIKHFTCTAFLVTMKDGGSGVLAKKSAIGVVGGWANSFVCRHSSIKGVRKISGV
jgi:hypothetical protein